MSKLIKVSTEYSAGDLRRLARGEDSRRAAMRMLAIAETLDGADRGTAARRADMSDQALCDAIKRFNKEGLDGLHDRPIPGRPAKLSKAQLEELRAIVLKGPDIETDGLSSYTRDDLVKIVAEKWHVKYAVTSMGKILRSLNLSRQKTRPSHPKKDPEAGEVFLKNPWYS